MADSLPNELEEGQLPSAAVAAAVGADLEELEEGQVRCFQRASHSTDAPIDVAHQPEEGDDEEEDWDRELSSLMCVEPAEPMPMPAPPISTDAAPIRLLRVDLPPPSPATTHHQSQQAPEASLWTLPLPARLPAAPAEGSPVTSLTPSRQLLRQRLLELNLPAQHVDAVLLEPAASAHTLAHPTEHWIDRVMDSMYRSEVAAPATAAATTVAASGAFPASPAVSAAAPIICGICWDAILDPDTAPLPACAHAFCASCWNGYLSSKVLANQVLLIRCPSTNPSSCTRQLEAAEIERRLRSQEMRLQYRHLAELARVSRDPTCRWCPTPGCTSVLRGGSTDQPRMSCPACRRDACFTCGLPWHSDGPSPRSCAEASAASLAAFLVASEELRACPGCAEALERTEGCNFVRCPRCQFEFCWLCLAEYTDNHFAWWNLRGCPLLHLQSCGWAGDDSCCCIRGACVGRFKRAILRGVLACLYALGFLAAAPFLLLASPCLLARWRAQRPARDRRKQLAARNKELAQAQRAQQHRSHHARHGESLPRSTRAEGLLTCFLLVWLC